MTKDDIEQLIKSLEDYTYGHDKTANIVREAAQINRLLNEQMPANAAALGNIVKSTERMNSLLASCKMLLGVGVLLLLLEVIRHW